MEIEGSLTQTAEAQVSYDLDQEREIINQLRKNLIGPPGFCNKGPKSSDNLNGRAGGLNQTSRTKESQNKNLMKERNKKGKKQKVNTAKGIEESDSNLHEIYSSNDEHNDDESEARRTMEIGKELGMIPHNEEEATQKHVILIRSSRKRTQKSSGDF